MDTIKMATPIVEMDGDEMTRVLWSYIKDILITPYVDLNTEYYDLGLKNRDLTSDDVTVKAAHAIKKYGVGVKCATITPNKQRVEEYNLKAMYKSPNGTIRSILGGTVFRAPILVSNIHPIIPAWTKPIIIARHAYGDIYSAVDTLVQKGEKVELVVTDANGNETRKLIKNFEKSGGVSLGMHNTDESIEGFARSCFEYALGEGLDLWFSTKDTISKIYDGRFKEIFETIFKSEYEEKFNKKNITYFYTLIDDAVARVVRSDGGFVWACKNYDGDVMSDMLATAYGSLAMMTSVLLSPDGKYEYEAAHGTVTRHYYKHLAGEETSTNPIATIFAWTGALRKRGELDDNTRLVKFAMALEMACEKTIEGGFVTKDLAGLLDSASKPIVLNSKQFIEKIAQNIKLDK